MVREHRLSVARACRAAKLSRAAYYRQGIDWVRRDASVVDALNALVEKRPRWGFWKCFDRLHNQGHPWNAKRVHRVYCKLRLNLPRRTKKRLPVRLRQPLAVPAAVNAVWALDFMSDALWSGRRFRVLNVLDEGVREGLAIEVDTSLPAKRVVRVLDRLGELRGLPAALRMDNGPELIAQELLDWCERNGVEPRHIQPGKPDQNAYIERYNRTFREEVLDAYLFDDLEQVREISTDWLRIYNEERPHDALGSMPPARFRALIESKTTSTSELST
jgi:putative transposase